MTNTLAHVDRRQETAPLDMTFGDLLRQAASQCPNGRALVELRDGDSQRVWTFAQTLSEAEAIAYALLEHLSPGERLGIWSGNRPEWLLLLFGAALAGITVVPLNPAYKQNDLGEVLRQGEIAAVIYTPRYRDTVCAAVLADLKGDCPGLRLVRAFEDWPTAGQAADRRPLPDVAPESPLIIQYTSGTTGAAKAAIMSHRSVVNNLRVCEADFGLPEGSAWIAAMPFYTISGSVVATAIALWNQGPQVVLPQFDPVLFFRAVEEEQGAGAALVPTMLVMLLDHPACADTNFDALKLIYAGGAPVAPALAKRAERVMGAPIMVIWGQTEAVGMVTHPSLSDPLERRATTIGYPLPGREVRIIDAATGETRQFGEPGEICVRGMVMDGYLNQPDATAQALDGDGWLHTGDIGVMDPDQCLRITGRLKDMIIRGGMNIFPKEIEDHLMQHPQIAEAAVVGVPDPKWGEIVGAAIRARDPANPPLLPDIQAFLADRIAHFKIPHSLLAIDVMPLADSGKVRKDLLTSLMSGAERSATPNV